MSKMKKPSKNDLVQLILAYYVAGRKAGVQLSPNTQAREVFRIYKVSVSPYKVEAPRS